MLDIKFIRENAKLVQKNAKQKGVKIDIEKLLAADKKKNELLQKIESLRAAKNKVSKEIQKASDEERKKLIQEMKKVDEMEEETKPELQGAEGELNKLMLELPAMPRDDVKPGKDGAENEIIKIVGEPCRFNFEPKDYMTLAGELDLIDTQRAAKVSGSRFGYIKGDLALLEFALVQYALETLNLQGFRPIIPPVMIKEEAMRAMGYLEHGGQEETYHFEKDNMYLVGTSEQSVGPLHMDEVLREEELPKRYVGFSTCFRREAGSYGKDTKGILRVHQFDKVEMFSFCHPDKSDEEHEFLLSMEENLMQGLALPYRVVKMCTGDLGLPAARKYDIETWLPSENQYRETHSTSACVDFQARRLNIRYKDSRTGKNQFVHMLNGTAFAIGRMLIMIIENFQQADGKIAIPEVLQKYFHKSFIGK